MVDDELRILSSFTRLFASEFEVVVHSDPRDALRCIEEGAAFDIIFCDLTMPHLTGMELYEAISVIRPHMAGRIVFVSGDLSRDDIRGFLGRVPNERIEKPFTSNEVRLIARRFRPEVSTTVGRRDA